MKIYDLAKAYILIFILFLPTENGHSKQLETPFFTSNPPKKIVVISQFKNLTKNPDYNWLERGITDMLLTQLASYPNTVTVERRLFMIALQDVTQNQAYTNEEDALLKAAQKLNGDWIVKGQFSVSDNNNLQIQAQLLQVDEKRVPKLKFIQGEFPNDLPTMLDQMTLMLIFEIHSEFDLIGSQIQKAKLISPIAADSYYKGLVAFENGSYRRAIKWLTETIQKDINFSPAHNLVITTFERMGNTNEVVEFYSELVKKNPKNYVVRNYSGNALMAANDLEEAQDEYSKAILLNPNFASPYNNLGNICKQWGMVVQARKYYEKALSLQIHDPAIVYNNLGLLHAKNKQFDLAEKYYLKALNLKHLPYETLFNLGNLYLRRNNHQKAIEYFTGALKIYSQFEEALQNLGQAYSISGNLIKARQTWEKLHEINPNNTAAIIKLAGVSIEMNDTLNAAKYIRIAFSQDSLSADLWKLKGILGVKKNNYLTAERALNKAMKLNSNDWQTALYLGRLYFQNKHYFVAIEALKASLKILKKKEESDYASQRETILQMLAKCFEKTGDYESAINAYRQTIELNPKNSAARFGIMKLERMTSK